MSSPPFHLASIDFVAAATLVLSRVLTCCLGLFRPWLQQPPDPNVLVQVGPVKTEPAAAQLVPGTTAPFQAPDAGTLRLRYSPRIARWIAEREGKPLAEDGSLTLEHPLGDTDWAVRHVLQYGPEVTVLEPQRCDRRWCAGSSG